VSAGVKKRLQWIKDKTWCHCFINDLVNLIVSLEAKLSGITNFMGWGIVAIYLLMAFGFGYFLFLKPKEV